MLQRETYHWWQMIKRTRSNNEETNEVEQPFATWKEFLDTFNEKYFPKTIWEHKELDFLQLVQGSLTVAQYEAKFASLSRYAPT